MAGRTSSPAACTSRGPTIEWGPSRRGSTVAHPADPGQKPPATMSRPVFDSRIVVGLSLAVVAIGLANAIVPAIQRRAARPAVPDLPDLSRATPSARAHLQELRGAALAVPAPAASCGRYCISLPAHMFFDAAEQCYATGAAYDPADWRWRYYAMLIRAERGDAAAVKADAGAVLAHDPRSAPVWLRLGDAMFKQGDYAG